MVYKTNESIIVIQAEATNPNNTDVVFWSHDRGTAKLRMKLVRKNGIPQSLPEGTTVPIRLMFKSATAEGGYGKHDYLATVEDPVNGIVSIVLEDNILGYVGTVEGSVYIDFPNDRSLDTAGRFTFYIKRSPIDDSTPELEDYYFNGFSQTIDKIEKILADGKLEIEQKIAESKTQINAKLKDTNDKITKANQDVATLNTNIDKANNRIDQTNQQIGDLGKLKKMYSNSIDFGDYDYLGRPNLMKNVTNNSWTADGAMKVTAIDDYLELVKDTAGRYGNATIYNIPSLRSSSQYTTSLEFYIKSGTSAEDLKKCNIAIEATNTSGQVYYGVIYMSEVTKIDEWVNLSNTFTTNTYTDKLTNWKFRVYIASDVVVSMRIRNTIKIEKGSTATPYQPNLLDAPYYLSKVALGKNIANKSVKFPINASTYPLYSADMQEPFIVGQTYTLTIKATKPSTQQFRAYNDGDTPLGYFAPVEGLTDVWSCNFIPTKVSTTSPKLLSIYQVPNTTLGACQIDWLKIEKGGTRTPNIQQYKYFGEGLKDSNDPNDYSWDITPEYAEKSLNITVSLTEPQTILGLKNFSDGIQIAGDRVVGENEHVVYTLDASNSKSFIDGYATFIKHGKIVIVNGTVKFKKTYPFGTTLEDVLPDEFVAKIVHGMLTGPSGTSSVSKAMYVRKDLGTIITNSEFAANEWFTFHGNYWVGEE